MCKLFLGIDLLFVGCMSHRQSSLGLGLRRDDDTNSTLNQIKTGVRKLAYPSLEACPPTASDDSAAQEKGQRSVRRHTPRYAPGAPLRCHPQPVVLERRMIFSTVRCRMRSCEIDLTTLMILLHDERREYIDNPMYDTR